MTTSNSNRSIRRIATTHNLPIRLQGKLRKCVAKAAMRNEKVKEDNSQDFFRKSESDARWRFQNYAINIRERKLFAVQLKRPNELTMVTLLLRHTRVPCMYRVPCTTVCIRWIDESTRTVKLHPVSIYRVTTAFNRFVVNSATESRERKKKPTFVSNLNFNPFVAFSNRQVNSNIALHRNVVRYRFASTR